MIQHFYGLQPKPNIMIDSGKPTAQDIQMAGNMGVYWNACALPLFHAFRANAPMKLHENARASNVKRIV